MHELFLQKHMCTDGGRSRISWKGVHMFALLILSHFSKISHENEMIETKLFHFHRIFKNGGQGGGFKRTPWTPSGSPTDNGSRSVNFGLSLHLQPIFGCARWDCAFARLIWNFAAWICDRYQILMSWLNLISNVELAWLESKGPRVRASPASLCCVLEQGALILA